MVLIGSILFFFLYISIVNERVDSETENLLSRGSSHRDVLENYFTSSTIHHVALMESEARTIVVITDEHFSVIDASNQVSEDIRQIIARSQSANFSHHGIVLESRWKTEPYLATVSPLYVDGSVKGYVYMFLQTEAINTMIRSLTSQFIIVGVLAIFLLGITTFFLSRLITEPLKQMKVVTEKLSKGSSDVTLDIYREDELGDLAMSIQTLSDDLERLKKERHEFLASISHELRTPLTYIKGYADILKRPNLSSTDREQYLTIVQEEVSNVTRLVKDLFDLAKMDQNQFEIHKVRVHLRPFLEKIIVRVKTLYEGEGVSLVLTCSERHYVCIDPQRFEQVIINFLDNALKYSPPNSNVQVSVGNEDGKIAIVISDEGEGIAEKDIPFIWDRLYRVDKSRSRATGGSGLGLTIAKEIIERHEGEIEVASTIGTGTTFTILLEEEMNHDENTNR